VSTTGSSPLLLNIEEDKFARCFSRQAFGVGHGLADHPLLTLDAMAELADRLPLKSIERHRADLPLLSPGQPPELEGPPSETVRELESGNAWMVMWYIEQVPEYRMLLDECLNQVETYVGGRHGGMRYRKAYLFLSAPGATTPAHFDPEQNLLLQIRGAKDFSVGCFAYPTEQQAELDRYFDGGHRNLDRMPQLETTFHMEPGDGVYVPPFAPHWVHVGEQASISLSITFRTRSSLEMERVSHFNARMRRLHLSPHPPGTSRARDRLKASMIETLSALRRRNGDAAHGDPGGS
jgi:Cupin superfamily protein